MLVNRISRGGVIGCGYFSRHHLEAWARTHARIVAACDPDLPRAQAAAPIAYRTVIEMFDREELDFVDIATRPDTHEELIRLAVERGIPVICQKPLAPDWEGALRIERIVRQSGVPVMVHVNWRWQAWHREIARRIAAGDIGDPITYAFRTRASDGLGDEPYPRQPYFREMQRFLILCSAKTSQTNWATWKAAGFEYRSEAGSETPAVVRSAGGARGS